MVIGKGSNFLKQINDTKFNQMCVCVCVCVCARMHAHVHTSFCVKVVYYVDYMCENMCNLKCRVLRVRNVFSHKSNQ